MTTIKNTTIKKMKISIVPYLVFFQVIFACCAHADFRFPSDESQLYLFFKEASAGKMDLKGKDGCYTLPETFSIFGTEEIKYLKIERNTIFLLRNPSDPNGFVLANYMSLDKILDSKRPEDLVASITLPDGRGYAEILSRAGKSLLKESGSEHVGNIAIRFCTVRNYRLHFFSLLFAAHRPDQAVDDVKRSARGAGPLSIKIDGIDIMYANVEKDPMWMERSIPPPGVKERTKSK